jgi:hypothetical protein
MPYSAAFTAKFAKPLIVQAIALVQRDQAAALAIVNGALPAIGEFHFGRGARTALPWLTVVADGLAFMSWDDLNYRQGIFRMQLVADIGEFDQEIAQLNAMDYVHALDIVITSAGPGKSLADWTTALAIEHEMVPSGMTSPSAAGTVKDVRIESHRYTLADVDDYPAPIVRGTLTVAVHLIEQ